MRWDAQTLDAPDGALPGLERSGLVRAGLIRTVRTPQFEGMTFHEVLCKSALNRVPEQSRLPYPWTVNPFRGCTHACAYCFARPTHEYLELNAGRDFDSQIVVKTNVVTVLRRELARASWKREPVALGTNTDPYQRAEGRYELMPGIVRALTESGTPFSILTKGTMLRRDLPLLALAAQQVDVRVSVSLAVRDPDLQSSLEPGTPSPRARLDLVRAITEAGLGCHVLIAPVVPFLTDSPAHLDALMADLRDAGATGATVMPLYLRSSTREVFLAWLGENHPALLRRYRTLYGRGAYVSDEYTTWLRGKVEPLRRKHHLTGVDPLAARPRPAPRRAADTPQPTLF
ncbi:Rv2578c family radical SAM protein [Rhodococcoides corynebacterioides]|uniref:Rv2578c family radical SAM protein n=1 Tax=Rhodococcoides corynebacterioides TaxID=53972 RepID=UPI001C9B6319|nr:Rv2578c family radical SAM protein [Rhodococcus corynebacterioides]MBY6350067.1 radical SAM protein [Rhodococcus corynebacterioides]